MVAYRIEALRAEYRVAAAEIGEAEERVGFNERQVERYRNLQSRGAASTVQLDEARLQLAVARDQVAVIRARMLQILANLGGRLDLDRKSTRLNSSHQCASRLPSSACTKKKKQTNEQKRN